MAVLEGGESFLKVSRIFVILSHVFLSRQSVFIAPALSHLGLSIRMYTYLCVCVRLLLVCIRACGPLKRLYWVIYCAAIAIMFCVSEQTLIYTWLYHMFSNISPCFSFVSLIRSLFVLLLLVQHFQFWFHWLSLSAVDRVSRVENLRWYFSFDDFTRCGIGCCCCGYLLLVVVLVKLVRFVYLFINLIVLSLFFFRFIVLLIFYNNLQYHKRITDSEGTMRNTHKI